jgi:glycosyltransferase involved in cell wall biosynthesis
MSSSSRHGDVRISCIICAYNEAPRIAAVLRVVAGHPLLHEVIVVNDGSTDETAEIVRQFPQVRLVSCAENRGKSFAMATGVAAAEGEVLMLLDADLSGLSTDNIGALAAPVVAGEAAVSISLRRNSLPIFRAIGLDFVSGERVVRRELLGEVLEEIRSLPRFGIEVFMNRRIIAQQLTIAVVRWPQVSQSRKTEKLGYWKGIRAEWRMIADLMDVVYPRVLLSQTWQLLSLQANRRGAARLAFRIIRFGYAR